MNKTYGQYPKDLGIVMIPLKEMMFYQDLPIKMADHEPIKFDKRLKAVSPIFMMAAMDFIQSYGFRRFKRSYMYTSVKRLFQSPGCSFNRPGYHADGFGTEDVNYVWSDCCPTIFNVGEFTLSDDDVISMQEMEKQADRMNEIYYPNHSLLRIDQYVIHKVGEVKEPGVRTFVKVTFSLDRYNLEGNAHNHEFDYEWNMRPRGATRNVPQS